MNRTFGGRTNVRFSLLRINARLSLLAFAAVLAGQADTLYVSSTSGVGAYDADTGASINANLIPTLGTAELAISGDTLLATNYSTGVIGAYNATTGAVINANFITGLNFPDALAISGNTLFVSNQVTSSSSAPPFVPGFVSTYNATTGALINPSFITGLSSPGRLLVSGNTLFVENGDVGPRAFSIGTYNASNGAAINPNFITTGPSNPNGLAFTGIALLGNTLFVADYGFGALGAGTVGEYDGTTGTAINSNFISGLNGPEGLALLGNTLFVSSTGPFPPPVAAGTVGAYNATTGAAINANLITGLTDAWDVAVSASPASVPEPSTWSIILSGGVILLGIMARRKCRAA